MRMLFGFLFLFLGLSSCDKQNISSICDQQILESASDYNNGPFDPGTVINSVSWNGECLDISISYGGGCEDHDLSVVTTGAIIKTNPPIMELAIAHDNTDQCEAYITQTISFGLGENQFLNDEEVIILKFVNPEFNFTLEK